MSLGTIHHLYMFEVFIKFFNKMNKKNERTTSQGTELAVSSKLILSSDHMRFLRLLRFKLAYIFYYFIHIYFYSF